MVDVSIAPKITVGIVSFNRPRLLKRAIQSVILQSYKNLEILISDNGSSDVDVEKIIRDFSEMDVRIRYKLHPINKGSFFNFQYALNEASGDYFIWLADDDYWCPEFLETLMAASLKSGASLTYGRSEIVDVDVSDIDRIGKELQSTNNFIKSMIYFMHFDTDSIFYGLFLTSKGKRISKILCDWSFPQNIALHFPFLKYNFVSYVFIYGLISTGGFCNASCKKSIHYTGGKEPFVNTPRLGIRHTTLFFAYVLVHIQMFIRFLSVAILLRSLPGVIMSPFVTVYFFFRRMKLILVQRLLIINKIRK